MPENIKSFESKVGTEREADRRVTQITHRNYEQYLDTFNLSEEYLTNAETVVDIGAGFSTFSKEAEEKFSGLKAIAVDPIYDRLKIDRDRTMEEFERQERIFFDFDPSYRGENNVDDLELYKQKEKQFFENFKCAEVLKHPNKYIAASHQDLPLQDKSADLVLAGNSILRSENSPQVIERAIRECLRIVKDNGEIRIAGAIACFAPTEQGVELWYNGVLTPGSLQAKELQETGHYSDPELMLAFANIEATGATFYCVVKDDEENGKRKYGFDTLIVRKDQKSPELKVNDLDGIKTELRKLEFSKNDGFNIPTVFEGNGV